MSNVAEMDAQEIINYIATAPKKTPVKLYVREKPGMKVAWGDAHVYGGRRGKTVFGDWDELKAILDANADSIDYYDVENDCRNSALAAAQKLITRDPGFYTFDQVMFA